MFRSVVTIWADFAWQTRMEGSVSMRSCASGIAAAVAIAAMAVNANAAVIYSNNSEFLNSVDDYLTDDYQNPLYEHGDIVDGVITDQFTNARMSAIFGETTYYTTGFPNNYPIPIGGQTNFTGRYMLASSDRYYCGGCNGSFQLDFTSTSLGSVSGVYGVGLNVGGNVASFPFVAFVTYGDNTTENFSLPIVQGGGIQKTFWGITSSSQIRTISFGAYGGAPTTNGSFVIDDLTIASQVVPIPPAVWLFGSALGLMGWMRRKATA